MRIICSRTRRKCPLDGPIPVRPGFVQRIGFHSTEKEPRPKANSTHCRLSLRSCARMLNMRRQRRSKAMIAVAAGWRLSAWLASYRYKASISGWTSGVEFDVFAGVRDYLPDGGFQLLPQAIRSRRRTVLASVSGGSCGMGMAAGVGSSRSGCAVLAVGAGGWRRSGMRFWSGRGWGRCSGPLSSGRRRLPAQGT